MKTRVALVLVAALAVAPLAASAADAPATLKTEKDKLSYSLGMDVANSFMRQGVDVDPALFARGFADAYSGGPTVLTEDEVKAAIMNLQKDLMAKQQAKMKDEAAKNKAAGEAFLAANAKKEGVVTLPSGLQYKVIKAGTGPTPTADDTVTVNYKGTLIDGTEFDSSYKRGEPATFPVKGVIPGWTEALQKMKVGSTWELFIPASLAYGDRGAGRVIGPDSTLVFQVELIGIKDKK